VGGQRHAPAVLPPGETRYTLYRRLGGPTAGLDGCRKSPTGIRSPDRPARSESLRNKIKTITTGIGLQERGWGGVWLCRKFGLNVEGVDRQVEKRIAK
jgi:hypothetical protein